MPGGRSGLQAFGESLSFGQDLPCFLAGQAFEGFGFEPEQSLVGSIHGFVMGRLSPG
jgi:hypothetical protein